MNAIITNREGGYLALTRSRMNGGTYLAILSGELESSEHYRGKQTKDVRFEHTIRNCRGGVFVSLRGVAYSVPKEFWPYEEGWPGKAEGALHPWVAAYHRMTAEEGDPLYADDSGSLYQFDVESKVARFDGTIQVLERTDPLPAVKQGTPRSCLIQDKKSGLLMVITRTNEPMPERETRISPIPPSPPAMEALCQFGGQMMSTSGRFFECPPCAHGEGESHPWEPTYTRMRRVLGCPLAENEKPIFLFRQLGAEVPPGSIRDSARVIIDDPLAA